MKFNFGKVAPSFMIIGVQKGGTTALHEYLLQHPKLISSEEKELHFFDTFKELDIDDYLKKFPKKYFSNEMSFEATPRYLYFPETAKKLHTYNSKMKFIVVMRDPVKRAYSAWNMYKQMGESRNMLNFFKETENKSSREKVYSFLYKSKSFPSFSKWVKYEIENEIGVDWIEPSIVRRGYYKEQIDTYLKYFSIEQFMFIDSSELKTNTLEVLNSVASFLKIHDFKGLNLDLNLKHKREYSETLDEELYQELLLHFQEKNKGLEELVGLNFKWMNSNI